MSGTAGRVRPPMPADQTRAVSAAAVDARRSSAGRARPTRPAMTPGAEAASGRGRRSAPRTAHVVADLVVAGEQVRPARGSARTRTSTAASARRRRSPGSGCRARSRRARPPARARRSRAQPARSSAIAIPRPDEAGADDGDVVVLDGAHAGDPGRRRRRRRGGPRPVPGAGGAPRLPATDSRCSASRPQRPACRTGSAATITLASDCRELPASASTLEHGLLPQKRPVEAGGGRDLAHGDRVVAPAGRSDEPAELGAVGPAGSRTSSCRRAGTGAVVR